MIENLVDVTIQPVEDQPSEFNLPKDWIGKRVKIIRVSKLDYE
ncbi:MAG: DUF2080 family transposase-associated protein [Candidatus Hodarchaeales archaeon]